MRMFSKVSEYCEPTVEEIVGSVNRQLRRNLWVLCTTIINFYDAGERCRWSQACSDP